VRQAPALPQMVILRETAWIVSRFRACLGQGLPALSTILLASQIPALYASKGAKGPRHPHVRMLPAGVVSGSAGVFFFLRDFVVGQERFQDCPAGLDVRDVSVQLGHYLA
jgi:hypothetical protein